MKKLICIFVILFLTSNISTYAFTLYSPEGKTLNIINPGYDISAYINDGWYTYPVVRMYAPDGRSIVVSEESVASWENVGWIDGRITINIYTPDGRRATIPLWQLQSYLDVGWYMLPVYKVDTSLKYYGGTIIPIYNTITSGEAFESALDISTQKWVHAYFSTELNMNNYCEYLEKKGWEFYRGDSTGTSHLLSYIKGKQLLLISYFSTVGIVQIAYHQ